MSRRNSKGQFIKRESLSERPRSKRRGRTLTIDRQPGTYTAYGYQAAKVATREGRSAVGGSAAFHAKGQREKLIHQARAFARDNGIFSGMIKRSAAYIVGNGFGLQAKTKSKTFNAKAEMLWREFWTRPEIKGILSGRKTESMITREILTVGDTGIILTDEGLLQLIEAEQIKGKTAKDGINKNKTGRPTSFEIAPYARGGKVDVNQAKNIRAENFLFLTDPERPSAIRAVPPCQAAFPMLHRINDVCDSEAIAWQMLARMAVSINRAGGAEIGYEESREDPNKSSEDLEGDLATRLVEIDYALIFQGEPGEEVKGIERNIPGRQFTESLQMFLRLLGLPLGLPLEIILLDWTRSNYSQSRAVLEQAYQMFLGWQFLIEERFHTPVYEWKLREWIAAGKIADRKDALSHQWIKSTFPWIDQLKEAQAYGQKVDRGFATHAQVCKSLNADRDDIVTAREAEVRDAIARAQAIEKETGQEVPWQIFAGLRAPGATAGRPDGAAPATSSLNEDTEK